MFSLKKEKIMFLRFFILLLSLGLFTSCGPESSSEEEVADTGQEVTDTGRGITDTGQEVVADTRQEVADTRQEVTETGQEVTETGQEVVGTRQEVVGTRIVVIQCLCQIEEGSVLITGRGTTLDEARANAKAKCPNSTFLLIIPRENLSKCKQLKN